MQRARTPSGWDRGRRALLPKATRPAGGVRGLLNQREYGEPAVFSTRSQRPPGGHPRGDEMTVRPGAEAPDRNLALELVRVTEAAAMAGARKMGYGDKV